MHIPLDQLPGPIQGLCRNPLIDQIPTALVFVDTLACLGWANRAGERLLAQAAGRAAGDLLGASLADLLPAVRSLLEDRLRQTGGQMDDRLNRVEIPAAGGRPAAWWDLHLSPVRAGNQALQGMLLHIQEVTSERGAVDTPEENPLRLRAFFDNSIDAILLFDSSARILDANPAACQLLGLPPGQVVNRSIWEVVPGINAADFQQQWDNLVATGREEGIFAAENIRGEYHKAEYRAVAHILPGVHLVVLSDITTRVLAEEKLRETEELLHNILDYAPMPIYAVTPDQHISLANRAWSRLVGPFRQGMSAMDLHGVLSEHNLIDMLETNHKVLESGQPVELEEHMDRGPDSLTFYTVKFPLRNARGGVTAVGGISVDITDRIRIELGLRESEQKFRNLVEQSNDGIILTDEQGTLIEWNRAQEGITGIPAAEAIGRLFWDVQFSLAPAGLDTPENYQRLKATGLNLLSTGQSPWLEGLWETDLRRTDGSVIHAQSSVFLVHTGRGVKVGSITRDVTREQKIQQEVNQRNRELTSLLEISRQISGELNLERMLQSVTDAMTHTLPGAEYAVVWLYDEERGVLVAHSCAGCLAGQMEGVTILADGNLVAQVFHSDRPIQVKEINPLRCGLPPVPPLNQMRALLGVPLVLQGRPLGAVTVCSFTDPDAFSEQDSRWLQSLAGQVVVLIANARLFAQVSSAQERLQALSRRLVEVQEEERRRIARELHDEIGQILTGLKLLLRMAAQADAKEAGRNLKEAQELTNDLLNRVHDLSLDLRPAMLDDLGLLPALLWQFDRFSHQTGIQVNFRHHNLEGRRFPAELETAVFRVVQEALTNVARHAGVPAVEVWIWSGDSELGLQVEDRGQGFDLQQALHSSTSVGLNGIRERAALLGGQFIVNSGMGSGTLVRAVFPLPPETGG